MRTKLFYVLFITCLLSCKTENSKISPNDVVINGITVKIYVIDSCEYIGDVSYTNSNSNWATHKGNCKFCAERALKNK